MNKNDIIKTLDIASFVSAVFATILVLVFQFTGSVAVMKYSIVMYVVCFFMLTIVLSFKVYFAFSKKHQIEIEKEQEDEKETEITESQETSDTKKKALSIVYLTLSAVALIFTFVLLILY